MRVPQVSERVKEAPAHALRAVFAGIGQVLLVADRMRNRPQDTKPGGPASSPGQSPAPVSPAPVSPAPASTASAAAAPVTDARPEAAESPADQPPAAAPTEAARAQAATAKPTAAKTPAAPAAGAGALPLANYDELTVASLRARMRVLDPAQLRTLIDYENSHAGRADVVGMLERRIAKIESGDSGLAG